MKILVTGATGFIGKNLVKALVRKKHKITCLVRKTSKKRDIDFLKNLKVKLVYGNINNKESIKDILKDVNVVYHLAGLLGNPKVLSKEYFDVHVKGTKNLIESCKNQKFIYCSSAGVLGPIKKGKEEDKLNPANIYEKTKAEAEKIIKSYNNFVILRPEFVYGPYDMHVLRLFRSIKEKEFRVISNGKSKLHPTYIDDLVYCLIKCLDKNIKNKTFLIAGDKEISVQDFAKLIAKELNVRLNKIKIPLIAAKSYVFFFEFLFKKLNIDPILTKSRLEFFTKTRSFNTGKARKTLKFKPISLEKGIKVTMDWYKEKGRI